MRFTFFACLLSCIGALSVCATMSPAERKIAAARAAIDKNPKFPESYANLAFALSMRARETSDTKFYEEGIAATENALRMDPQNIAALKAKTWILLGTHEFTAALESATRLNKMSGDDVMVYGFLSDAHTELGNYPEAEKATQRMLNLRPGNIAALTRAAHLRELFGDTEGALELMRTAVRQLPHSETENAAWLLTQISHLQLMQGDATAAERTAAEALSVFADYHYALGQMAKVRRAQKRYKEAAELETKRYQSAPHPENLYMLAEALDLAGSNTEARNTYARFEKAARAEMNGADNANHDLIRYYAGPGKNAGEAVRVAQMEMTRRQDVHTLYAYSLALYAARNYGEARKQIERALAVGIRDQEMLQHATLMSAKSKGK